MDKIDLEKLMTDGSSMVVEYAPKILGAILIYIVGFWLTKRITRFVQTQMSNRSDDPTLSNFLGSLISILLKTVVILAALGMLGIETTSFLAILGAAGLAIGLALQGSLANFAGGVMILLFRPFKVGDLIDAQGFVGTVDAINIFVTSLITPDGKRVSVPNGPLSNGPITNMSNPGILRVDLVIGIGYGEDIGKARNAIMEVMKNDDKVLKSPEPSVNVESLGDSSVNLAVRPYATTANYWDVYFGIQEKAKVALDAAGIDIPFPQRVVHQA